MGVLKWLGVQPLAANLQAISLIGCEGFSTDFGHISLIGCQGSAFCSWSSGHITVSVFGFSLLLPIFKTDWPLDVQPVAADLQAKPYNCSWWCLLWKNTCICLARSFSRRVFLIKYLFCFCFWFGFKKNDPSARMVEPRTAVIFFPSRQF